MNSASWNAKQPQFVDNIIQYTCFKFVCAFTMSLILYTATHTHKHTRTCTKNNSTLWRSLYTHIHTQQCTSKEGCDDHYYNAHPDGALVSGLRQFAASNNPLPCMLARTHAPKLTTTPRNATHGYRACAHAPMCERQKLRTHRKTRDCRLCCWLIVMHTHAHMHVSMPL